MGRTRIRLRGYSNAKTITSILDSDLIDVLYVDEVTPDAVFLVPDLGGEIDFEKPDDFDWASGLIRRVLEGTEGDGLIIELEPH